MGGHFVSNSAVTGEAVSIEQINGLYSYALVLTRNHSEAEDLVQETYARALSAVSRLRPESNLKSWLFTILRNAWLNTVRRRRAAPEASVADFDEDDLHFV